MLRHLAIGAATCVLLGTSVVCAQPAPDAKPPASNEQQSTTAPTTNDQANRRRPMISREDAAAYLDARLAALHAGLELTPDQERMWPSFEKAYRDLAKLHIDRMLARRDQAQQPQDLISRLRRRADAETQQGAALKTLADAAAPLWQSFDDGQKRRFAVLARPNLRARLAERFERRFGGPGRDGRDGGRDGDFRGRRFGGEERGFRDFGERFHFRGDEYGYGGPPPRGYGERRGDGERRGFRGDEYGYGPPRGHGERHGDGERRDFRGNESGRGPRDFGPRDFGPPWRRGEGYGRGDGYDRRGGDGYRGPGRGYGDRWWRDDRRSSRDDDDDEEGFGPGAPRGYGERFGQTEDEEQL